MKAENKNLLTARACVFVDFSDFFLLTLCSSSSTVTFLLAVFSLFSAEVGSNFQQEAEQWEPKQKSPSKTSNERKYKNSREMDLF